MALLKSQHGISLNTTFAAVAGVTEEKLMILMDIFRNWRVCLLGNCFGGEKALLQGFPMKQCTTHNYLLIAKWVSTKQHPLKMTAAYQAREAWRDADKQMKCNLFIYHLLKAKRSLTGQEQNPHKVLGC